MLSWCGSQNDSGLNFSKTNSSAIINVSTFADDEQLLTRSLEEIRVELAPPSVPENEESEVVEAAESKTLEGANEIIGSALIIEAETPAVAESKTFAVFGKRKGKRSDLCVAEIRRCARRGGCKRMSATIYAPVRESLRKYLTPIIRDTVTFAEHSRRRTIIVADVLHALKRNHVTIYGIDYTSKK